MKHKSLALITGAMGEKAIVDSILAYQPDAHLEILVIGEAPPPPVGAHEILGSSQWAISTGEARENVSRHVDAFEAALAESERSGRVSGHVAGLVYLGDLMAAVGRVKDLVMIDATGATSARYARAAAEASLFLGGAAILLVPEAGLPASFDTIHVAWNATRESGRALRAAVPLLKSAQTVKLVCVDPVPGARGHGPEPGAEPAQYLAHHGVSVEVVKLPTEGLRAEEVLSKHAKSDGADLLVMGAYGHTRLREQIFGGTTRAILDHPPCAVLMAH